MDNGGIGLPRVFGRAQVIKWRAFHRSLTVDSQVRKAITDILHRTLMDSNPTAHLNILHLPDSWQPQLRLLARSLIKWMLESSLSMPQQIAHTPSQIALQQRNQFSIQAVAQSIHL